MRKFQLILSFLLCTLTIFGQNYITTIDVNVRAGAGTKFDVLGTLPNGSTVKVLDRQGNWAKIDFNGSEGFISSKFIQTANEEQYSSSSQTSSSTKSNWLNWIIGIGISLLVFKLFGFKKLFGFFFHETAKSIYGEFTCKSCGKTQLGRDNKTCPNGGQHEWYKI